jgi:probable F420-dependent oxidoreductase
MMAMRFGVVFTGHYSNREWKDLAAKVEGSGFSTLLVADHYMNPMACGPLMMTAAATTTTLRVGSYVYNNDFRPPALLAKEVATIDVLSGGRMEVGIGAGWAKGEYVAAGIQFDPPPVRFARFEEGVGIVRRLLAGETVDHRGDHYRLRALEGLPVPVQQPVPLLIGCGGPRMTRFAARAADIVGFVPQSLPDGGLDPEAYRAAAFQKRVAALDRALADREGAGPERSVLVFGIGGSRSEITGDIAELTNAELAESPYALVGSPRTMADALLERNERWGLSYTVCFDEDLDRMIPVVAQLGQ